MSANSNIKDISKQELQELIERIEHAIEHDLALSSDDLKLLLVAINTLCTLQQKIDQDDVTLYKLRKLLGIIQQSERRKKTKKEEVGKEKNPGGDKDKTSKRKEKKKKKKKTTKAVAPVIVKHKIINYNSGQQCPECTKGKLYKHAAGQLLRISGHAPYEAKQHLTERLRCNTCQYIVSAGLPAEVLIDGDPDQKYGHSARTMMAMHKFYSGMPYYHQENLNNLLGHTITASTIFDQCEHVANTVTPVFNCLKRIASGAYMFMLDDTHNRILSQQPELRQKRNAKGKVLRTGIYSSGLISFLPDGNEVILFETSLGHAGEHLDSILASRDPKLSPPITMSDALSNNNSIYDVIQSSCNAHSRRQFVDLEDKHPDTIEWILDKYSVIWQAEDEAVELKLSPTHRLEHHKEKSLPAMEEIKSWAEKEKESNNFEEHSGLGKAIKYFLKHYHKLVAFCKIENALLDNNRMEEKLKIIIRGRKLSHFYKSSIGAMIANILLSMIATAAQSGVNIFHYLQVLQQNAEKVRLSPDNWLPWNYEEQFKNIKNIPKVKDPEDTS